MFRPYTDWERSAACLDDLRLGKQRVEAKQILYVFLRKLGIVRDGKRGWLTHPIVLLYFNNGKPYIDDVVGFFQACVKEWKKRGKQNFICLDDIQQFIRQIEKTPGTPITRLHEIEYRRILLIKNPNHYVKVFSKSEILEVLETEPIKINGVNSWLFKNPAIYKRVMQKIRKML